MKQKLLNWCLIQTQSMMVAMCNQSLTQKSTVSAEKYIERSTAAKQHAVSSQQPETIFILLPPDSQQMVPILQLEVPDMQESK